MNHKISFLMPVNNEEKILKKSLEHLSKIPYKNYEVIIGLDGCTDNSEEIVKKFCEKSNKFKYYKLNLRQGKPAVIDFIIKKAKGDIIIINDADWLFISKNKDGIKKLVRVFDDPKIGGIAESFPSEWHKDILKKANTGYKIEAYSTFFWYNFQKEKFTYTKNNLKYLSKPTMFLTNIFRKKLYKRNFSLGDDFERTENITKQGYEIIMFDDINMPRMKTIYSHLSIKSLFNNKIRTAIAREQLKNGEIFNLNLKNYYLPVTWYIFKEGWRHGIYLGLLMTFWILMNAVTTFIAKFKKIDTKKGWLIRTKR